MKCSNCDDLACIVVRDVHYCPKCSETRATNLNNVIQDCVKKSHEAVAEMNEILAALKTYNLNAH